jgi:hypothetical protein
MEVRDGFITDIFNYCDQWCRTCAFTSRCQLFADIAEAEGALDPAFKAVIEAPPLPRDVPPPPPAWMQEILEEMNDASTSMSDEEFERVRPKVAPEHESIRARAQAYFDQVQKWLPDRDLPFADDPRDPCAVVAWFHTLILAKIFRALTGLASDIPEERSWPADHDGSAKVALLGIERSHVAWLQLVERGLVSREDAEPFVAALVWLGEQLERVFPNARAFVRPAFDEPDEVARIQTAKEGGR